MRHSITKHKYNVLPAVLCQLTVSKVVQTLLCQTGGMQGGYLGGSCFLYNRDVGLLVAPLAGVVTTPTVRLHGSWIARVPVETSSWPTLTTLGTHLLCMGNSDTGAEGHKWKQYVYGGLRRSVYVVAEHGHTDTPWSLTVSPARLHACSVKGMKQ